MKKYITIAALLAAGTAVANAATAEELNTNIKAYLDTYYEAGANYSLSFVVDDTFSNGTNWLSKDVLTLAEGWTLYSQMGQFVGLNAGGGDISGWLGTNGQVFSDSITVGSEGWLYNASGTTAVTGAEGALDDATVTISSSYSGQMNVLQVMKGESVWVSGALSEALDPTDFVFNVASSSATLTIGGVAHDITAAIPEPSAFGLLAGLGALALVASRRRRK